MEKNALIQILNNLIERYKTLLKENGKVASGDLLNSIKGEVRVDNNLYTFVINLNDYWKYLENGVNGTAVDNGSTYSFKGKTVNTDAIEKWITVKGIVPHSINNKVPSTKQLAYVISRSIARNGIKGGHYLNNSLQSTNFINNIIEEFSKQVNIEINKITEVNI